MKSPKPGTRHVISSSKGPGQSGPVPGTLTEEEFLEEMSNLRQYIDNACEELRQKLETIRSVAKEIK